MSTLREFAIHVLTGRESGGSLGIIKWWEFRRAPYNVLVGISGVITCIISILTAIVAESLIGEPIGFPDPPAFAILFAIIYAVAANACFTLGWIVEILLTKLLHRDLSVYGQAAFVVGTIFSMVITLLPAVLVVIVFGITLLVAK